MTFKRKIKRMFRKFKRKPKDWDIIEKALDEAIKIELEEYNDLDRYDAVDAWVMQEHLERLEELYKLKREHHARKESAACRRSDVAKVVIPVLLSTTVGALLTGYFWYKENVKDGILTGVVAKEIPRVILNQIFRHR